MTREEALKAADAIVAGWIADPPKNARGYSDGWKTPSLEERTRAVRELADFLWEPAPEPELRFAAPVPAPTLFGWALDGSGGKPTRAQYDAAVITRTSAERNNTLMRTEEAGAISALIYAYENPTT